MIECSLKPFERNSKSGGTHQGSTCSFVQVTLLRCVFIFKTMFTVVQFVIISYGKILDPSNCSR